MLTSDKHEWLCSYHCRKGDIKRCTSTFLLLRDSRAADLADSLQWRRSWLFSLFYFSFWPHCHEVKWRYYLRRGNIFLEREVWVDVNWRQDVTELAREGLWRSREGFPKKGLVILWKKKAPGQSCNCGWRFKDLLKCLVLGMGCLSGKTS